MYEEFYGLVRRPFEMTPDPAFLVLGDAHREGLATLLYGVQARKGFVLLTGEVGTGKTTLLHSLLAQLDRDTLSAFIFNPRLEPLDFFRVLFDELGIEQRCETKAEYLLTLNHFLIEQLGKDRTVLLIVDEAQNLSAEMLEEIRLLSNLETPTSKLIQIMLVGQPELWEHLARPELRQLRQRIVLRHQLRPFDLEETQRYVEERLRLAGFTGKEIFKKAALKELHRVTGGTPRLINIVCDGALLLGFGAGEHGAGRGRDSRGRLGPRPGGGGCHPRTPHSGDGTAEGPVRLLPQPAHRESLMGKVYDALRRAEEQRARRADEATTVAAPAAAELTREAAIPSRPEPEPLIGTNPAAPAPDPGPSRSGGLLGRLARRDGRGSTQPSAGDLNKRRIAFLQPESFVAEQFRTLRARLDSIAASQPLRTIAVTSALPGDGKTLSALSLAGVTAMSLERRVLLIDCDLRRPGVAPSLGLRVGAGLAEVLLGTATLEDAILPVDGSTLHVLPVRQVPDNPSELLASEGMRKLIETAAAQYDRVILDLPPTLGLPDAKTVSELCDGILFVVRADVTPGAEIDAAIDVLDRRRILGLVMNGSEPAANKYTPR